MGTISFNIGEIKRLRQKRNGILVDAIRWDCGDKNRIRSFLKGYTINFSCTLIIIKYKYENLKVSAGQILIRYDNGDIHAVSPSYLSGHYEEVKKDE